MAAVVRASNADEALARLRTGYSTGDAQLLADFESLAAGRLRVYAGAPLLAFDLLPHSPLCTMKLQPLHFRQSCC